MAYLHDFDGEVAWYGFTNVKRGFGAGLAWNVADFPCAWFWQELNGTSGYPWYKGCYVMAIEPNTSYPGLGLSKMIETSGMQRELAPQRVSLDEDGCRALRFEDGNRWDRDGWRCFGQEPSRS